MCNKEAEDLVLMLQNHKHSGSPCIYMCIKPGGVPYTYPLLMRHKRLKQHCPGIIHAMDKYKHISPLCNLICYHIVPEYCWRCRNTCTLSFYYTKQTY